MEEESARGRRRLRSSMLCYYSEVVMPIAVDLARVEIRFSIQKPFYPPKLTENSLVPSGSQVRAAG